MVSDVAQRKRQAGIRRGGQRHVGYHYVGRSRYEALMSIQSFLRILPRALDSFLGGGKGDLRGRK